MVVRSNSKPVRLLTSWVCAFLRIFRRSPGRILCMVLLIGVLIHRIISFRRAQAELVLAPIASISRKCPSPNYKVLSKKSPEQKICLTTLTDEKKKSWITRLIGWRNFDGMLQLTWENKASYSSKHGYHVFDESSQLDPSRPASWSKIRAVQRLLREEQCSWVLWLDADAVIMNSEKRIEEILPSDPTKHLIVTADDGGGFNAGVWIIHNSEWSSQFLQEWWDMKSFVMPPGFAKSGDNDALKHKLKHMEDFDQHILSPPRCSFNSFVTGSETGTRAHKKLEEEEWYMSEGHYHKGDFIAHVAGIDGKVSVIRELLALAV